MYESRSKETHFGDCSGQSGTQLYPTGAETNTPLRRQVIDDFRKNNL